jgi:hypothetical protein
MVRATLVLEKKRSLLKNYCAIAIIDDPSHGIPLALTADEPSGTEEKCELTATTT